MDLGHRADGGAWIAAGGLLLDGDGRRQALDQVHIGLAHQLQELARIGRKRLHIAALALGIDGVKGQRRFARSRQPGDHHQLAARNIDRYVLEVMFPRATHADEILLVSHALPGTREAGARGQRDPTM